MHGEAALTPLALWMGAFVRFGVPVLCAAIAIDALRRPAGSLGRRERVLWAGTSAFFLAALLIGFLFPSVVALRYFAVLAVPLTLVLAVSYLLSVVFARRVPADSETA